MYWTINPIADMRDSVTEPLTLCEHHALEETNNAMKRIGSEAFGSMVEAYAVLTALTAMSDVDLGMTSSELGTCAQCEHDAVCSCGRAV